MQYDDVKYLQLQLRMLNSCYYSDRLVLVSGPRYPVPESFRTCPRSAAGRLSVCPAALLRETEAALTSCQGINAAEEDDLCN